MFCPLENPKEDEIIGIQLMFLALWPQRYCC
jgi:hypothetical protein